MTFQGPPDNPAGNTRWPGNEDGVTGYPNWSTVTRHANDEGAGHPEGKVWQPGECDVPLRNQPGSGTRTRRTRCAAWMN